MRKVSENNKKENVNRVYMILTSCIPSQTQWTSTNVAILEHEQFHQILFTTVKSQQFQFFALEACRYGEKNEGNQRKIWEFNPVNSPTQKLQLILNSFTPITIEFPFISNQFEVYKSRLGKFKLAASIVKIGRLKFRGSKSKNYDDKVFSKEHHIFIPVSHPSIEMQSVS
jgi:hypothetical protein